ncbi:MAG: heme biosynthesis protein HemY, partial [Alsobacter sp.]
GAALGARDFARARTVLAPLLEGRPTVRVCLLMADLEDQENDASGAVREWLARASWAPRDAAWIADGVITDRWAPVSPVTGRLDAFVWGTPIESLEPPAMRPRRRPEPAPALPSSDHVLADVDEPEAPVLEAAAEAAAPKPVEAPAAPPAVEPAPAAAAPAQPVVANPPEPTAAAAAPAAATAAHAAPAPSASTQPAADTKVVPLKPDPTEPARPRRAAADVVFPMASAPDDPGPDRGETPSRGRTTFLQ